MRTWLSKFALMATFGLAMSFPFSCSLLDDKGDDSSSSGGGGTPTNSSPGGNPGGGGSSSSDGQYQSGYNPYIAKWMTTNLSYDTPDVPEGSKCYSNSITNCTKYGKLYNWAAAMDLPQKCNSVFSTSDSDCRINTPHKGICPTGKHIPTKNEWDRLITEAGGEPGAGNRLKSHDWTTGNDDSNPPKCKGSDNYGFAAMPGGYGYPEGNNIKFAGLSNMYCNTGDYVARWWSASEGGNASYAHDRLISRLNSNLVTSTEADKSYFLSVRCLDD